MLRRAVSADDHVPPEPEPALPDTTDDLVRRVDPDRWLASRFADRRARAGLSALYALIYEIARIPEGVSDPALGLIRLQWWKDAIASSDTQDIHPALSSFMPYLSPAGDGRATLLSFVAAHEADFEEAPFASWTELETYIDATAGAVIRLAAQVCVPNLAETPPLQALFRAAGRTWAFVGLLRAQRVWAERGRTFFPRALLQRMDLSVAAVLSGGSDHEVAAVGRVMLERARATHRDARRLSYGVRKELFPAYGYVTLARDYIADLQASERPRQSLLGRQTRLVLAALTGTV